VINEIEQLQQSNIYRQLADRYDVPIQVIEVICNSPFKFTNKVMADPTDNRSIMLAYLFKIKLKNRLDGNKQNKLTKVIREEI
jgi:hypothetical protein